MMHPALTKFFDSHKSAAEHLKATCHAQIAHAAGVHAEVTAKVARLEAELQQAELAAHDDKIDPKLEWMTGRLRAVRLAAEAVRTAQRELAREVAACSRSFQQDEIDLMTMIAERPRAERNAQ